MMILYLVQRGTFSFYNQSIDSDFLRCHYFFRDSRMSKVQYRIASSGNGIYILLGLAAWVKGGREDHPSS